METANFVLQMKGIGKEYYGTRVLENININLAPGEIHAVLGENGAGKSTLMNILFGMSVIHSTGGFEGEVLINGESANIKSPVEAMEAGIGMVHQEFMLIPEYTITENIKLNREITKPNIFSRLISNKLETLDRIEMNKDAKKALKTLDLNIEEWIKIAGLPVGYMQFVEIAREIDKSNLKVLVFDEPTAVLTESEASNLLDAMRTISSKGIAILFITHRLDEVMEVADNMTVLRDGKLVGVRKKEETSIDELAEMMVGRKINKVEKGTNTIDESVYKLELKNFSVDMPGEKIKGMDLKVRKGEIIGIGGLAGQGKIGVANGVAGLYPSKGEVLIDGTPLPLNNPKESINRRIAFVSEDRRAVGLLLDIGIDMNIAVTAMQNKGGFLKHYGIFSQQDTKAIKEHAEKMRKELDIRCTGVDQPTRRLSGGNQQKVCIARALTLEPEILFVSEPTRGIDVGAKKLVLDTLVKLNQEKGMTIVMTSSELGELRSVCDRIAIINEGKLEGILSPDDSDKDYGLMMAGNYSKKANSGGEVE